MSKIKNLRILGFISAAATMMTCTGCTLKYEGKNVHIDDEIVSDLDIKQGEDGDIYISYKNEQVETKETPEVTTIASTEKQQPVTTKYTTTLNETTSYKLGTIKTNITRITPEPRGFIPTTTTTTTTVPTTTVAVPDIISNLNFVDKEESHELPSVTINVSNKYIAKASGGSVSGRAGEGIYRPAKLYRELTGKSQEEAEDEICKLNSGKGTFIFEGTSIDVPFTTYYCSGKSVYEVSEKTGIDVNKIIELNRIDNINEVSEKEKDYLVMITKEKQDFYTNIEGTNMAILDNGLVVAADNKSKVNDNTYLTYHKISENQNAVNRVYVNGKTATITPFAYNVASINNNGIICSKDTKICLFNTMAVYTNGTYTLVSIGQLPVSPTGYKLVGHKEYEPSNQKRLSL